MDARFLKVLCIIVCIYLFIQFISLWTINNGQDDGKGRKNEHYVVTSVLNEMQIFCVGYRPRRSNSGSLAQSHPMNLDNLPTPNLPGTSAAAIAEINSNAAARPDLGLNHIEGQRLHNEKTPIPQPQEVQSEIISQDGAPTTNRLNNTANGGQCTENASAHPIVNNTRVADENVTENAHISQRSAIHLPLDLFEDMYKDEMCEEKVRLATFKLWPHHSPSPAQMAMAGFYYTPENLSFREESTTNESLWIDDTVFCFWCGLSLREWKQGDSPVHDHHWNSPRCNFIRRLLNESFDCTLALQPFSVETSGEVASGRGVRCVPFFCFNYTVGELVTSGSGATQYRNATTSQTSGTNERISATSSRRNRIDRILDSSVGRRVIEEGFSRARVAEAIDSLIAGNPHFEVSYDLLKATLISMRASRHQRRRGEDRDSASTDLENDDE